MNVLAIDDEKMALVVLVETIKEAKSDINLYAYRDVEEALEETKNIKIDVAFLDVRMKKYSGIDVAVMLEEKNPQTNIIFVTGYQQYQDAAFKMHASGYLTKPVTKEGVMEEFSHLRYPVIEVKHMEAKTFGNFDFFVDGKPLKFGRSLAKEFLAYLVAKRGKYITRQEMSLILFDDFNYDRKTQNYLTQIIKCLKKTLDENGVGEVLIHKYDSYSVDVTKFSCDYYEYLDGKKELYNGQFMMQYVWAEDEMENYDK